MNYQQHYRPEFTDEPIAKESPSWGIHFGWDWQRFLLGFSFQFANEVGGACFALNLGFLCVWVAKDKWAPWQ